MHNPLIVLKFGSSVLRSETDLPGAVHEIYRWVRDGYRVIAVVSALGNTTNSLLERAEQYGAKPDEGALAALLATGENTSVALLGLALDRAGIPAALLDPARIGLLTTGRLLNARPVRLGVNEIRRQLERAQVAVVPGFTGVLPDGRTSLLGRGGSDLTALFLAHQLHAERCRLIKDVDGVFEHDPASVHAARRFQSLTFDDALRLSARVVQPKALRFAAEHNLGFEVAGLNSERATRIGTACTWLAAGGEPPVAPLRVALLGLGTVGYGVYQELAARPDWFRVVGIAVRRLERDGQRVPRKLLACDPWEVIARECDVVVELIGGTSPACELVAASLAAGKHVVTANKAVLARDAARLERLARTRGVRLGSAGAVGGAIPVLETIARLARGNTLQSVDAVLNGTTNLILDELARGCCFEDAVALAQAQGFAEADPTADLDGSDAACKLALVARAGFGMELAAGDIARSGIADLDPRHVFDLGATGRAVRLVASLKRTANGVDAAVRPQVLDSAHPLAQAQREQNAVVIETSQGQRVLLRGKGAGRWPTTEAVLADLLSLLRERAQGDVAQAAEFVATATPNRTAPLAEAPTPSLAPAEGVA